MDTPTVKPATMGSRVLKGLAGSIPGIGLGLACYAIGHPDGASLFVGIVGAFVGAALAQPDVSTANVITGTIESIVHYNVPWFKMDGINGNVSKDSPRFSGPTSGHSGVPDNSNDEVFQDTPQPAEPNAGLSRSAMEGTQVKSVVVRKEGTVTIATIPAGSFLSESKSQELCEKIRVLAEEVPQTLVLDIRDILLNDLDSPDLENPIIQAKFQVKYILSLLLEPLWAGLKSRGHHLILVVPSKKRYLLEAISEKGQCPMVEDEEEGLIVANKLPKATVPTLDDATRTALIAIQTRFEQLVRDRIGNNFNPPIFPNIVHLYGVGERNGGRGFYGGGFSWSLAGIGPDLKLVYIDSHRFVGGWGCKYEITPSQTTLTAEGLD